MSARTKKASFVILRQEYLEITGGDFCAAKLIEYFIRWTHWKMQTHRTPWFYQPLWRIQEDLLGEHSENIIRRAIALLEELGLIERRHNPGNWQDKTWQYKFNLDRLSDLLRDRNLRNEESCLRSEPLHKIKFMNSDPQQHNAAVEEKTEEVTWEEVAKEVQYWEMEVEQLEVELIDSTDELIPHEDQSSGAALNCVDCEFVVVDCDEVEKQEGGICEQANCLQQRFAIAPAISSQQVVVNGKVESCEDGRAITSVNTTECKSETIPQVVATATIEELITIDSPPVQKVGGRKGFGSGREGAIASANSTQEPETLPKVVVTPKGEGVIAPNSVPQNHSKIDLKPPNNMPFPAPPSTSPLPIVPKKLNQAELDSIEAELKRLNINPDSCMRVVRKYWGNVGGAIARVKEALQQGWCQNATGLFIKSCKEGLKPIKALVDTTITEWFNWAYKNRIVIAMTGGHTAFTPDGVPVSLKQMMELYPMP
jgi:hypothetical protein